MTHEDLMQRIRRMPYEAIRKLSATDIWKLTFCFNRELVKEIVAKKRTPESQVEAIVLMKNTRIMALKALKKPITKHPEYFNDWLFDIRTGVLVEATPPVSNVVEYSTSPSSNSTPKVETVAMASKVANDVADKFREFNTKVAELQARIKELEEELEKKNREIEGYKAQGKGVSASKHALLLTTLCHHLGGLPQNGRQSLSPILQKLYGYTEATATRALNQKFKQTDVDALAKLFSGLSSRVGNAIKEMPSIIEKQNNERLRKLNEQKNG